MNVMGPLAFALIAAIGNAVFAAGQKKASILGNPFSFLVLTLAACLLITALVSLFYGPTQFVRQIKVNGLWALLSGLGLFFTYLGFNLLFSRYGTSSYVLYAVLSIITTSVIVGVILFKESFNLYHWLAFGCSLITVVLFSIGNNAA